MEIPFGYRRLAYVALNVTDIERSVAFYRDLVGLTVTESGQNVVALRCSRDHHNLMLYRAAKPGIKRIGLEVGRIADVTIGRDHVEGLGYPVEEIAVEELRALRIAAGFRFRLPSSGLCIELFAQMMLLAQAYQPTVAKIERLGHVVLNVSDFESTVKALTENMGFRVSDYVPGFAAFLRCFPNPLHHSLAILAGSDNHLNHLNFMVTDIDDVGRAMNRMKKAGVEIVFGPGRHQPSESIFLYFLDPDRITVEYSFGMETFPEVGAREARLLEPVPETLDTWGGLPSADFGKVGAIESAGMIE